MGTTKQLSRRIVPGVFPESQRWYFDELFDANETGVLFDPSDLSTMYQEHTGLTPVTAPGQPVGLILDKSRGLTLGPNLITNGTFDANITGWTNSSPATGNISWSGGKLLVERVSGGLSAYQTLTGLTIGRIYRADFNFEAVTGGVTRIVAATTTGVPGVSWTSLNNGPVFFPATATTMYLHLSLNSANGTSGVYDNISVREFSGTYANQPTAASRPIYGTIPKGVRKNLLLNTDLVTGAVSGTPGTYPTSWSATSTGGTTTVTSDGLRLSAVANRHFMSQGFFAQPNTTYCFSCICTTHTTTTASQFFLFSSAPAGSTVTLLVNGVVTNVSSVLPLLVDAKIEYILSVGPVGAGNSIRIGAGTSNTTTADITIRQAQLEIGPNRTDYQTIATVYSPRRNLINNTDIMSSTWAVSAVLTRTAEGTVNGFPATRIQSNTESAVPYNVVHSAAFTVAAEQRYLLRITAKDISNGQIRVYFGRATSSQVNCRFDLTTGVRLSQGLSADTWRSGNWTSTANSDGSYTIQAVVWSTTDRTDTQLGVHLSVSSSISASVPVGNAVLVSAPSFELGEIATPYQRVANSVGVTEQGVPTCHYLQFDGVDDFLVTPNIDFSGTDKASVFAATQKLSDAGVGTIIEQGPNSDTGTGFSVGTSSANGDAARRTYIFRTRGTTASNNMTIGNHAAPEYAVLTSLHDTAAASGSQSISRRNGVAGNVVSDINPTSSGNYLNSPIHIGRRGGISLSYNGLLFGLIARGILSTTNEIRQAEKLLANKTPQISLPTALDPDALEYFTRVEVAGGNFASSSYSANYTKLAINDYVLSLKSQGLWSKIPEIYLFVGPTFPGVFQKLKHAGTAALTNVGPFVTGDYTAAGALAGLVGNNTKHLNTSYVPTTLPFGMFAYLSGAVIGTAIGSSSAGAINRVWINSASPSSNRGFVGNNNAITAGSLGGHFANVIRQANNDLRFYVNGSLVGTRSTTDTIVFPGNSLYLFASNEDGTPANGLATGSRMRIAGTITDTFSDAEAANLSNITNAFMTKFGANVY
jgi:hypothetical protein